MLRISITHTLALPRTCSVSNIHTRTFTHLHVARTQPTRNPACLCSLSRINHTLTHIHVALMQSMLSLVCSCSVSHTHLRTPVSHTHILYLRNRIFTYCSPQKRSHSVSQTHPRSPLAAHGNPPACGLYHTFTHLRTYTTT